MKAALLGAILLGGCLSATGPPGTLERFLAACSAPDSLEAFARREYAVSYVAERGLEGLVAADRRVCIGSGGLDLEGDALADARSFFGFARGRDGEHYRIALRTGTDGRIVRRSVMPGHPPPDTALIVRGSIDGEALDRWLDRLAAEDRFSGVVVVARDGDVLYAGSRKTAITNRFGLASAGKMFTAAAVMQLVERGRLRLDDTVDALLPDFPNRALAQSITAGDLLAHRSGLPMLFDDPEVLTAYVSGAPLDSFLDRIARETLRPEPRAVYSNAGYLLLGRIVEVVSGMEFGSYLQANIFGPAGMSGVVLRPDEPVENAAIPYTRLGGDPATRRIGCGSRCGREYGSSAGGGYATAHDMARFLHALSGGALVAPSTYQEMKKPRVLSPWGTDYGFGLAIERVGALPFVGHAGDYVGTNVEAVTTGAWTIVVMSNYERPAATGVADALKLALARDCQGPTSVRSSARAVHGSCA